MAPLSNCTLLDPPALLATLLYHLQQRPPYIKTVQYLLQTPLNEKASLYALLWQRLDQAPANGSKCTLIANNNHPDHRITAHNNTAANRLAANGWTTFRTPSHKLVHTKLWLIYPNITIIGSANLTLAALTSNHELSILTTDQHTHDTARAHFTALQRTAALTPCHA